MKINISNFIKLFSIAGLAGMLTGCKKYLEVPLPVDQLATETVYQSKSTIDGAMNGMYSFWGQGTLKGNYYRFTYWLSDEGEIQPIPGSDVGNLIAANISQANTQMPLWSWFYTTIYRANDILENLPNVPTSILPEATRKQYIAAAKYVRAAEHFLLVNAYGDVPLITSTSADENFNKPRTPAAEVYQAIIKDLQDAMADLPTTVNTSSGGSLYIHNKFQPQALLAKVYLYLGRWAEAEAAATDVIASGQYQLVTGVNNVFKRGSREAITSQGSTGIGQLFDNRAVLGWLTLPASSGNTTTTYCAIPASVLSTFEPNDQRRVNGNWTINLFSKTFANKYLYASTATTAQTAANPQDFIYQRLAEIYLIRAEARAKQNNISGAATDLNAIRTRAGLPNTTAATQADMLAAIERERVYELFYEGHRWFDLKRTGRLKEVLSAVPYKKDNYKDHYNVWPIPLSDMNNSPSLVQNPGYE